MAHHPEPFGGTIPWAPLGSVIVLKGGPGPQGWILAQPPPGVPPLSWADVYAPPNPQGPFANPFIQPPSQHQFAVGWGGLPASVGHIPMEHPQPFVNSAVLTKYAPKPDVPGAEAVFHEAAGSEDPEWRATPILQQGRRKRRRPKPEPPPTPVLSDHGAEFSDPGDDF